MATKHNFATSGPKAFYNKEGKPEFCHSEDEVARAKQAGFTNQNYVPSNWPTTVWNKKTGESRPVGKLEWDLAKNRAAVAALGDDWTTEHVPVPEPVATKAAQNPGMDLAVVAAVMADNIAAKARIEELEEAIASFDDARSAADDRMAMLEAKMEALLSTKHEVRVPAAQPNPQPKAKPTEQKAS